MEDFFKNYYHTFVSLGAIATTIGVAIAYLAFKPAKPRIEASLKIEDHCHLGPLVMVFKGDGDIGSEFTVNCHFIAMKILNKSSYALEINKDSLRIEIDKSSLKNANGSRYQMIGAIQEKYRGKSVTESNMAEYMESYPVKIQPKCTKHFYLWTVEEDMQKNQIEYAALDCLKVKVVLDGKYSFKVKKDEYFDQKLEEAKKKYEQV